MSRRVVITGIGAVTPLGNTVTETWTNLISLKSGVGRITLFDPSQHEVQIAAEIKNFDPHTRLPGVLAKKPERVHRVTQFAIAAALEAFGQSGLTINEENEDRVAVFIGSGGGGLTDMTDATRTNIASGPNRVSAAMSYKIMSNASAGAVSKILGAKGASISVSSACATGSDAIGLAMQQIAWNEYDVVVAGGTEAVIDINTIAAFGNLTALTKSYNNCPESASRPFDVNRSGFVFGEGAAIVVLEAEEHALSRGAEILGCIAGYGATDDAFHETKPDGLGSKRAMRKALVSADLKPEDIGAFLLHGTSTSDNDHYEALAVQDVFGDQAKIAPAAAIKSQLGHMIGAAGSIAPIIATMMFRKHIIPATLNLTRTDEDCHLNLYSEVRQFDSQVVACNALGFGGHNSILIISAN